MTLPSEAVAATRPAKKTWSLPTSIAAITFGMPTLFWLQFGVVDGFAIGFTAFLMLLVLAVECVPPRVEAFAADNTGPKLARSRFDWLGVVWLLSVPFAPFLSWMLTSVFPLTAANWRPLLATRALLCVVVPLVCVLPLLRYVRGSAAGFMIAVLLLGTAFPVLCGIDAAIDSVRGPQLQELQIVRLRDVDFRTRAGTRVHVPQVFVDLADGRTLRNAGEVNLHLGSMRLYVLRSCGYVLATP